MVFEMFEVMKCAFGLRVLMQLYAKGKCKKEHWLSELKLPIVCTNLAHPEVRPRMTVVSLKCIKCVQCVGNIYVFIGVVSPVCVWITLHCNVI